MWRDGCFSNDSSVTTCRRNNKGQNPWTFFFFFLLLATPGHESLVTCRTFTATPDGQRKNGRRVYRYGRYHRASWCPVVMGTKTKHGEVDNECFCLVLLHLLWLTDRFICSRNWSVRQLVTRVSEWTDKIKSSSTTTTTAPGGERQQQRAVAHDPLSLVSAATYESNTTATADRLRGLLLVAAPHSSSSSSSSVPKMNGQQQEQQRTTAATP
jgi:hypothetical protein